MKHRHEMFDPAQAELRLPSGSFLGRWFFLRLLGFVYLAAFMSAMVQAQGLIGSRGILPVAEHLARAQEAFGNEAYLRLPTLFWLDGSDTALKGVCIAGATLSGLLILGILPIPVLAGLWALYLSLVAAGQEFFNYQWDGLLLETGLCAVFFAPWGVWPKPSREATPSPIMRWLLCWLLFRLMFTSGVAKLLSGDPTWRDLSALLYHYETQPLPTWFSWFLHQAPGWVHAASVVALFVAELVLPVLLFGPRRWRHRACAGLIVLQLVLMFTGNFGFFNLLALALCVPQLDDGAFPSWVRNRLLGYSAIVPEAEWRDALILPVAGILFALSLLPFVINAGLTSGPAQILEEVHQRAAAFHSVNTYGLFAVMTTTRREIVIEGSDDGRTWLAYEVPYKPGDLNRRPEFSGLHMPRLDWQMWFAALGDERASPWLGRFLDRLHEGAPEVTGLLEHNPFPNRPPRFLRATLYEYRFTDAETRSQFGIWWSRQRLRSWGAVRGAEL
jgi:hypothetical protein